MQLAKLTIFILSLASQVLGWGDLGHRTVALVAQKYLTPETQQLLDSILENTQGYDFSDAAVWADTIKTKRPYTKPWHYIDAQDSPPKQCGLKYPADCGDPAKDGCIITAISNQTAIFLSSSSDATERKEALMFMMHLIGDLHQPLHVENTARGGNEIKVCFKKACANNNLHSVWDKYIPHAIAGLKTSASNEEEKVAAAEWADKLVALNGERGVEVAGECADVGDAQGCTLGWARESNGWICKFVLKQSLSWLESHDLSLEYYKGAAPIVEELIGKGGARLGAWLNALAASAPESVWVDAGVVRGEL